jgi:hypothetical protein
MWIDSLMRSPVGIDRVTDALGFTRRTVHAGKLRFPAMPCIFCSATTPTVDPNRWTIYRTAATFPDHPGRFACEMGGHGFTLGDLIDYYNPTKQKVRAFLEKIGSHEPQLIRTYTAEYDSDSVSSKDAEQAAIEVLPAVHNCQVRIVGIDAPSLKIGRQIAGQCRKDLPWATVDVKPNGTLLAIDWHRGRLTDVERLRMTNRKTAARFQTLKVLESDVDAYRRQRLEELEL